MMKFESDLSTEANTTVLPTGTPDLLDIWFEETLMEEAYGDWAELIFDPDCDPPF
jgi:hypothetical protein